MSDKSPQPGADYEWRNLYGRRRGKPLRPGQQKHLETSLPQLSIPGVDRQENPERRPVDLAELLPGMKEVHLEIGFGSGEHLIAQARGAPGIGFLGAEHYVNGVASLLARLERDRVENVRLTAGDARDLLDVLPSTSIARIYLLYPDPWPKARHHKRRFVNTDNLDAFARILRLGGELRVASDIPDYINWTLRHLTRHPGFEWTARRPQDWHRPWGCWPGTRYEQKALSEGRTPCYLTFRRQSKA